MRIRSWRGILLGALIALALPLAYWALAKLIDSGSMTAPAGSFNDVLKSLGLNASLELVLGSLGIWIVGRGAGFQSPWAWLALILIAVPVLAFVWFLSYATLGGAMGSPF